MELGAWCGFLWLSVVLALSPGPAVLFVVAQGLRWGGALATAATAGILLANAFYFALSGLGIGAVLRELPQVLAVVKWAGALWIAWLGVQSLRSRGRSLGAAAAGAVEGVGGGTMALALVARGFALQIANPKALIYFVAILPPLVDQRPGAWPVGWQLFVLGTTSTVSEFFVLLGYGCLAGQAVARMQRPEVARAVDRLAGAILIAVAVWMLLRT